jgi:predicted N-formylglutamate amidohydrolase
MGSELEFARYESYEEYGYPGSGPFLLTCEHASNRIPAPLRARGPDRVQLETHWGWDIGARTVSREIIRTTRSFGVFARYSRLVCDPNRAPDHPDLIRCAVAGEVLGFNAELTIEEVDRRLEIYHAPYHAAVDRAIGARLRLPGDVMLLAVHSFTPVFEDEVRGMDVGVLFHPFEGIARRLAQEIRAEGLLVAMNEPYSARDGLMYAATRHGSVHGTVYLELEINQRCIGNASDARRMGRALTRALQRLRYRGAMAASAR